MAAVIVLAGPVAAVAFLMAARWQRRQLMLRRLGQRHQLSKRSIEELLQLAPFAAGVVALIGVAVLGPLPGVIAGGAVLTMPRLISRVSRQRLAAKRQVAIPDLVEQLSRCLIIGMPIQLALLRSADICPSSLRADMHTIASAAQLGVPLDTALTNWSQRDETPGVSALVMMLRLGLKSGGVGAPALEALAESLRDALELREEIDSEIAQAKASVIAMVGLPIVMGVGSGVAGGSTGHFLFRTSVGSVVLACGLALDALGALWMHFLVKRVQP